MKMEMDSEYGGGGRPGDPLRWIVRSRTGKFDVGLWVSIIIFVVTVVLILWSKYADMASIP